MKTIPLALPTLGAAEARAASEAVLSGWVTQGPRVRQFEETFAASVGASHACAVSNCTAAIHLALLAVGVRPGDVVITVSHSFIATANAVRHCGAEPVFVDIQPDTLNMDPTQLHRCLRHDCEQRDGGLWYRGANKLANANSPLRNFIGLAGRVAAILVVHQVGMPADLNSILTLAQQYSVPLVEDAACAIGSEITLEGSGWERIGRPHGEIACFSFHPRKVVTTGDGGMLTTNNVDYDRTFRLLRHHGMGISDIARHQSEEVVFEQYLITGFNFRMTDIQAAVGIEQLKRLGTLIAGRREVARAYSNRLSEIDWIKRPSEPPYARSNWQSYIVRLGVGRDQKRIMQEMKVRGISTRRGVMCAHLEAPYADAWPKGSLPESEAAQACSLALPIYPAMSHEELDRVAAALSQLGR